MQPIGPNLTGAPPITPVLLAVGVGQVVDVARSGNPLDRSKVLKRFKAAMKRAGLGHRLGEGGITFHSLRHSFGTAMAGQGIPVRNLQELMGHRDFATTLIYVDYSPSAHEAEWAEAAFTTARRDSRTELRETERT